MTPNYANTGFDFLIAIEAVVTAAPPAERKALAKTLNAHLACGLGMQGAATRAQHMLARIVLACQASTASGEILGKHKQFNLQEQSS